MVLDQEAGIEPERLGLHARVDVISIAARRIAVPTSRLGATEQAEPHASPPSRRTRASDCDRGRICTGSGKADERTVSGLLGKPRQSPRQRERATSVRQAPDL